MSSSSFVVVGTDRGADCGLALRVVRVGVATDVLVPDLRGRKKCCGISE